MRGSDKSSYTKAHTPLTPSGQNWRQRRAADIWPSPVEALAPNVALCSPPAVCCRDAASSVPGVRPASTQQPPRAIPTRFARWVLKQTAGRELWTTFFRGKGIFFFLPLFVRSDTYVRTLTHPGRWRESPWIGYTCAYIDTSCILDPIVKGTVDYPCIDPPTYTKALPAGSTGRPLSADPVRAHIWSPQSRSTRAKPADIVFVLLEFIHQE